jgi:predicted nucleic acid-binding protein
MRVLGTVGILVWGKKAGLIESLRTEMDLLESKAKFRLSQPLRARALSETGE